MKKKYVYLCLILLIFVLSPSIIYLTFPNTSKLIISLLTHTLPNSSHLSRIRNDLLEQDNFIDILIKHEEETLNRFKQRGEKSFVKKYIYKTSTPMFDIHAFHDYWETWVRTDVINGRPLTSFLIRLGLIKDTNAKSFFSNQCTFKICKSIMKSIVSVYNKMFDWGIFKPIRLNITELDETSFVSRNRITKTEWNEMVKKIHQKGSGKTFINFKKNSNCSRAK